MELVLTSFKRTILKLADYIQLFLFKSTALFCVFNELIETLRSPFFSFLANRKQPRDFDDPQFEVRVSTVGYGNVFYCIEQYNPTSKAQIYFFLCPSDLNQSELRTSFSVLVSSYLNQSELRNMKTNMASCFVVLSVAPILNQKKKPAKLKTASRGLQFTRKTALQIAAKFVSVNRP